METKDCGTSHGQIWKPSAKLDFCCGQFRSELTLPDSSNQQIFLKLIRDRKSFLKFKKLPQTFKMLFSSPF